jgi:DNA-binding MarR family transcriptional regulator
MTERPGALGPSLRRAWVGYQRQLDQALAEAGFADRAFPDGRVLRMCRDGDTTTSQIGRELGISRQGASKVVANLRARGYVSVEPSTTSGREKVVKITPRALEYLAAHRTAARAIERRLRAQLGPDAFASLEQLVEALGGGDQPRMRDYLRQMGVREI